MLKNWTKIKNEYINNQISYRELAKKHNISFSTLSERARVEKWVECKKRQKDKIATKLAENTAEKIVNKEIDRMETILALSDMLAPKIQKAIEQLETILIDDKKIDVGIVDTYRLRQITQTLKDIKDIVRDNQGEGKTKEDEFADRLAEIFGGKNADK